ncbi:MAG: type II toxin-antitoxin system death-on-curing family toxin [Chloroflexota bacterium]
MNSQNANDNDKPAKSVRYLTVSDLYNINFTVTGGTTFVRDIHLLESAAKRPTIVLFGQPQFPTLIDKAAALMHSLAAHHLFADGNKRTAVRAAAYFLELNGVQPAWTEADAEAFLLSIALHQENVEEVAAWLHAHTE